MLVGIFMDTLEDNLERTGQLFQSAFQEQRIFIQASKKIIRKAEAASSEEKNRLQDDLQRQLNGLYKYRNQSTLWEKILMEIKRAVCFESEIVERRVNRMIEENDSIHDEVCSQIHEIRVKVSESAKFYHYSLNEEEERKKLLRVLMDSIAYLLENNDDLSVQEVKSLVRDASSIIALCENEIQHKRSKRRFQMYLLENYEFSEEKSSCKVCKGRLWREIYYCLNCYERK